MAKLRTLRLIWRPRPAPDDTVLRAGFSRAAIAVLFWWLASSLPFGGQSLPEPLEEVFSRGVAAEKAGHLDEAEKDFLKVLREGGKVAFVYNNLGILYQLQGDHARAIAQFREAIRLQPDYVAPRILLGASLLATAKVGEATRELERAVKLQPQEPRARLELVKAYERAENFSGMIEQSRTLRQLAPEEPEYAYQLGRAYLKQAEWSYRQIKRLDPRSARAYQALAETYRTQGRIDLAIRTFQRAARADTKLPGLHLALAEMYLQRGETAQARREVGQELSIVPESRAARRLQEKIAVTAPER